MISKKIGFGCKFGSDKTTRIFKKGVSVRVENAQRRGEGNGGHEGGEV